MTWRAISTLAVALLLAAAPGDAAGPRRAVVLEVNGAIGPAVADYVAQELAAVKPSDTGLVILRMNTPGGLDGSMRKIIRAILASPVPVATFVAPGGARAASAGTYITYASAVAAMAPGTNIGAATPMQIGAGGLFGGGKKDEKKVRHRNGRHPHAQDRQRRHRLYPQPGRAQQAQRGMGRKGGALGGQHFRSRRAQLNVIDVVASDVPDLLRKIDGRSVIVAGKPEQLQTTGLRVVTIAPGWRTEFLAIITNPNVAFILMLIGIYGIIFEFTTPGTMVPGTIGVISLLLALYALNLLPINYAGAGLVLIGVGLMIAEVFIGSFGVIGIAGVIAFGIGSFMMFNSGVPGFELSLSVLAAAMIVTAGLFVLVIALLLRSRKHPVVTGQEGIMGAEGEALAWQQDEGKVRVQGEIWRARSSHPLEPGTRIKVVNRDGLVLHVEPA